MKLFTATKRRMLRASFATGFCSLALASASAAPTWPQEGLGAHADDPESSESFQLIQERRRDLAHPGDPLAVSGVFDGDNDLTAGRGALGRSDFTPVQVDQDEAYERQLAMLENRTTFSTANARDHLDQGPEVEAPVQRKVAPKEAPEGSSGAAWLGALAVAVAGTCALVLQGRK